MPPMSLPMQSLALVPFVGGNEWIWILVAILVLFGGRKLPELARALGSSITQFKKGLKEPDDPDLIEGDSEEKAS